MRKTVKTQGEKKAIN